MGSAALAESERATSGWAPQVLETALLVLLKQQPRHGYALVGPMEELGVDVGDITRLYRALRNLESEGVVTSTWDTEARGKGPARKVYSLTRQGNRHLRQRIKSLRANTEVMARIDHQYSDMVGEAS